MSAIFGKLWTTEQGSSQPGSGWRQSHWRGRYRALLARLSIVVTFVCLMSCGPVQFVPSPYTPQNVDLIYSVQEDISIVRWRISATAPGPDLKFQFLGDNGYQDIDYSHSVYPGGASLCGDGEGSCFQHVVRGHHQLARPRPVR